jgi:hypothetical protein
VGCLINSNLISRRLLVLSNIDYFELYLVVGGVDRGILNEDNTRYPKKDRRGFELSYLFYYVSNPYTICISVGLRELGLFSNTANWPAPTPKPGVTPSLLKNRLPDPEL